MGWNSFSKRAVRHQRTERRKLFLEDLEARRVLATVGEDAILTFDGSELGLGAVVADYRDDWQGTTPKPGWAYRWNSGGPIGNSAFYSNLLWVPANGFYDADGNPGLPGPNPG